MLIVVCSSFASAVPKVDVSVMFSADRHESNDPVRRSIKIPSIHDFYHPEVRFQAPARVNTYSKDFFSYHIHIEHLEK